MTDPPDPQPSTTQIGRDQINAPGSQGFINRAESVTQNFVEAPATPRIPACPAPNAAELFGRDAMIGELAGRLIEGQGAVVICAVRGLPGVGKTDLLRATGRDGRITAHFASGVLYAELGPTPSLSSILRRWIAELGHRAPQSDDPETLAAVVRAALHDRRALLILDDVWESSLGTSRALRDCASPDCRALASSRSAQVAREAARGAEPLTLDVLSPAAALDLVRRHAPAVVARDEAGAAELAKALGYLPLALKLAGHLLANDRRSPQPIPALLTTWRARLDQLRGYETRPGQEQTDTGSQLSLDAIIGLSYDALPDDATRAAAAALAAFGAMPLDWDWDAMAAVWATDEGATTAFEQALVGSGLIEWDERSHRYSLHATIHAFLERRAELVVYERHAAYFARLMLQHGWETLGKFKGNAEVALATLDCEIGQMERAQRRAAGSEPTSFWDTHLVNYAFACTTYFDLRGLYEQAIVWSEAGRQSAQRQGRERDVATLLHNIANVYRTIGHYDAAIAAYQEAITVYQVLNLESDLAMALGNLGNVYTDQGLYDKAIIHHQKSLEIKRAL
jgi:tetratricopeptide (TPR) repeat protein